MLPLCRGAVYLTCLHLFPLPSKVCPCRWRHLLRQRAILATADKTLQSHSTCTFGTDGIPFIVDNSASTTCIITNKWSLFIGNLTSVNIKVYTIEATQMRQRYEGTRRLELVDDSNVAHTYEIPGAIHDPSLQFNLLGIPELADFFKDRNYLQGDDVDSDGTTVKSSGCRSRLTWDHSRHTRNYTRGDSTLPKIMLYQGHGYFDAFCTRLWHCYQDGVAFAFSSAFSISPSYVDSAAIVLDGEDSDEEDAVPMEEDVDWFSPPLPPSALMPPPSLLAIPSPINSFELGMSLSFYDGTGQAETAVYEGVMPDCLTHSVRRQDGTRLNVHDAHICLKMQANLTYIPQTPLDYCKEVGKKISMEEAEALAHPRILSPVQQELMDWHHRLYHLSFPKIFCLAEKRYLPKGLLKCKGSLPLCVACQFGTAHQHPCLWRTRGKASGLIHRPEHELPGDGVSIDQIVSAQPVLIPQMSDCDPFLTVTMITVTP